MTFTPSEAVDVLARIDAQLDVVNLQRDKLLELREAVTRFMDAGEIQQPGPEPEGTPADPPAPVSQPGGGERRAVVDAAEPASATTRPRVSSADAYSCPEPGCDRTFASKQAVGVHRRWKHGHVAAYRRPDGEAAWTPTPEVTAPAPPAGATTYLCSRCGESYPSKKRAESCEASHPRTDAPLPPGGQRIRRTPPGFRLPADPDPEPLPVDVGRVAGLGQ